MSRSLSIRLVSPRLEPVTDVGAEVQIEEIARRLAGRGHRVEVLTTCVRDDITWKNHHSPGLTQVRGIMVRRFPADPRRLTRRSLEAGWRIERGEPVPPEDQEGWLRSLGYSSPLREHIARTAKGVDAFVFAPAVAGTTLAGLPEAAGRALLISALRDNPSARLERVKSLVETASLVLAGSEAERSLIRKITGIAANRIRCAGAGVHEAPGYRPDQFRERHGLEVPFLMYAGRRHPRKGLARLLEYLAVLVGQAALDLRFVMLGSELIDIPGAVRDHVLDLHTIGDQDKKDGMAAALAFCQPSPAEGLALAPMEAWLAGRPVLADSRGAVTAERCRDGGGGLWYRDYPSFEECVRLLLEKRDLGDELGRRGREYVRNRWGWERDIIEIESACTEVADAASGGSN